MSHIDLGDRQHLAEPQGQLPLHAQPLHFLNRLHQPESPHRQGEHHQTMTNPILSSMMSLNSSLIPGGAPAIAHLHQDLRLQQLHTHLQYRHHHNTIRGKHSHNHLIRLPGISINTDPTIEDEDSDGLELPGANLRLSRSPAPPTPAPEPDFQLYPQLIALANEINYNPVAITGSDNSYRLPDVPAIFLRHVFPSAPGEINLAATSNTSWQLPSNILHQLYHSTPQHQQHTIQQSITPWGLFTRMGIQDAAHQHTHYEQSLTIPFATRTASPELAIIRWLIHQRITHERQRVTRDYLTELTRNRHLQPGSYFNSVARDFITTAADIYRATRGQNAPARTTFRNMAQEILTLINNTTQPAEPYGHRPKHYHRSNNRPTHLRRLITFDDFTTWMDLGGCIYL